MPGISTDQLLARLSKGKPIPAILLLGNDSYLRGLCRKKIAEAYVAEGARDWGIKRFSANDDEASDVIGAARMAPMLAPQQVIFVAESESWERLGEDSRDALVKNLAEYLSNPAPFTVLVFEATELDQRMRLAKMLAEKTLTVSVELSTDATERMRLAVPLAIEMARELGAELEKDAAEKLCEILNGELASVHTEVAKLAAYAGEGRKIRHVDVDLLVVSERTHDVWELTEMLTAQQPARALEYLDSLLREGEAPVQLLGAMAWTYRKLLEAQELPAGTNGWQAASRLGMRPQAAELAVKQSSKFPRTQLTKGLEALYQADNLLKSGGTGQRAVMEFLVVQLASPGAISGGPA
jgi:DNA polymerase-3 subunit delta